MTKRIRVTQLAYPCLLRHRGRQAAAKLLRLLYREPVDVDLCNVEVISASFLHELVHSVKAEGLLERLTFRVCDDATMYKLGRIAAISSVRLRAKTKDNKVISVTPRSPELPEAEFVALK